MTARDRVEQPEGYAIVGIGCRFPGGATSPEKFWELLAAGQDAISDIPEDRSSWRKSFDPDPTALGRHNAREGGFLRDIDRFDSRFFGISPREAARMDPQQRLLLEVVWEAFEDAGIPVDGLAGSSTGVFVGMSTHDYADIQMYPQNRNEIDSHSNTGGATSIAPNRISYCYDFRGPSVAVDTACSSALTAVHLACRSLAAGDCTVAVACGAQILLAPELTIGFCRATMLSPDGRCKAFDAAANGYVRSEGLGAIVLKPLRVALDDHDPIHAVIIGTSINQDGHSSGLTVPTVEAQKAMLRASLREAGVDPSAVQYVEAHGTGTSVGDPIEAQAIGTIFREGRTTDQFCAIGSVKTNIGHLEAASGIAGLIKTALALEHQQIPPSLHFNCWNPAIDAEALRLRVVTRLEAWPATGGLPTAAVNSFGFGGANASVLLRAPPGRSSVSTGEIGDCGPYAISARTPEALKMAAATHAEALRSSPSAFYDLCHTSLIRRVHHEHRAVVIGSNLQELADSLDSVAVGETRNTAVLGRASTEATRKVAFVFSGMGPQWWGMGRQLRVKEPAFREMLERCDAALQPHSGWSLLDEFAAEESHSRVADPELAQVTNFAIQMALACLWRSWGIEPDAVMGHSGGAMAAACIAGIYTLEEAIWLAYHRSRLQGRPSNAGAMLAVGLPAAETETILRGYEEQVALAAVNGPNSLTFSGVEEALEAIAASLLGRGVFARMLPVTIAYHSPKMDPIRDEFLDIVRDLRGAKALIPFVSDTTGDWAIGPECDGDYWWRAIRQPVLFAQSIRTLLNAGFGTFVEISPHPVLSASIAECIAAEGVKGVILPSLRRNESEQLTMLRSLGALHANGRRVAWGRIYPDGDVVRLPSYPWQRERHWFEPKGLPGDSLAALDAEEEAHPLLRRRARTARPSWETSLGDPRLNYLDGHVVQGSIVFPAAAYVEIALAIARHQHKEGVVRLREIEFLRPFVIANRQAAMAQLFFDPEVARFDIYGGSTGPDPTWVRCATGVIATPSPMRLRQDDIVRLRQRCPDALAPQRFYAEWRKRGLSFGDAFRGLSDLYLGRGEAFATIGPIAANAEGYAIHPAMLDGVFQLLAAAVGSARSFSDDRLFLPTGIDDIHFHGAMGSVVRAHCRLTGQSDTAVTGEFTAFNEEGATILQIRGFQARLVDAGSEAGETIDQWLYDYIWETRSIDFAPTLHRSSVIAEMPESLLDELRIDAGRISGNLGWRDYYEDAERALSELAASSVVAAFHQLGIGLESGDRLDPETFGEASEISPTRTPLLRRLLALLIETGVLQPAGTGWVVAQLPQSDRDCVLARIPRYATEVELLMRAGEHLAAALRGLEDGREFLFTPETLLVLDRFYERAPASAFYNTILARTVSELVARSADTGYLRILEVGAGTGGTTAFILPLLPPHRTHYVFTDASSLFLDRAREKFGDYPFVVPRLLNIAEDPVPQGFAGGSFDLIIAANVIHATPDVTRTVETLRTLLADGGVLAMVEITRHPFWLDVIFGQTEGWWAFRDRTLRTEHPLLESAQWQTVLWQAGFGQVGAIHEPDIPGEAAQTILLARAPRDPNPLRVAEDRQRRWLILADSQGVGTAVADALAAFGRETLVAAPGQVFQRRDARRFELRSDPADGFRDDISTLLDTLLADHVRLDGVLHLWSLDRPDSTLPTDAAFGAVQSRGIETALVLVQELLKRPGLGDRGLYLVTSGAHRVDAEVSEDSVLQSLLWGFGRALLKEHPELPCRLVDLSSRPSRDEIVALVRELTEQDPDEEIALRRDKRWVRRLRRTARDQLTPLPATTGEPPRWRAHIGARGALGTLHLSECRRATLGADEVEIEVAAASVNYRDLMLAMGTIPGLESEFSFGRQQFGSDCCGRVSACGSAVTAFAPGDEVVAIAPAAMSAFATTRAALTARKPASLDYGAAASLPTVFTTAWYGLNHLAHLRKGESVLIHAATGGVGLAAIQIAQAIGAEIFATAGSTTKREYLASLGIANVMDSRTLDFADEILARTSGRGVDVVLNSLSGEAIARGLSVLKPHGRFLEIGKRDIYANHSLALAPFRRNLSYFAIDLDRLCAEQTDLVGRMLRDVLERIETGIFHALPTQIYPVDELEAAFRLVAQAKHIGKVVVTNANRTLPIQPGVETNPRIREDGTYLITGGLGGFGLALAEWLAARSAGALVLMGRRSPSARTEQRLAAMRALGSRITVYEGDVGHAQDVRGLMASLADLPPLRGIFHAAMVLDDKPIAELDRESLDRVISPKALGAWNLHHLSAEQPIELFVLFSSIASLLGNPLQGNYGAACAFIDALAHHRKACGLPAVAINWGVLSGTGYVADRPELESYLEHQGYLTFSPKQALAALDAVLRTDTTQITAARFDWRRLPAYSPQAAASPRIRDLIPQETANTHEAVDPGSILGRLAAEPEGGRAAVLGEHVRAMVARVLGMPAHGIELDRPLNNMGLDSLLALELTVILDAEIGVRLPIIKLLDGTSVDQLARLLLKQIQPAQAPTRRESDKPAAPPEPTPVAAQPTNEHRAPDLPGAPAAKIVAVAQEDSPAVVALGSEPAPPDEFDYASLNYTSWSPRQKMVRTACKAGFRILANVAVKGIENIPADGPCIIAVNHLSMIDVPLALTLLPRRTIILATERLRHRLLLDWFVSDLGQAIYVSRNDESSGALRSAIAVLKSGGLVALSPEGTRSRTGLLRGRTGVAYLATNAGVPVIPFVAWGQEKWRERWKRARRLTIEVRIGAPIRLPSGPASAPKLREYTDRIMLALAEMLPDSYRGAYAEAVHSKEASAVSSQAAE